MRKRLASLILLLVLAGGAFAGVPLPFGEQSCGMGNMDCCKAALMQSQTAEADVARLSCALNCLQNGATTPSNIVRVTPPAQVAATPHPAIALALLNPSVPMRNIDRSHGPPDSVPVYIRHLALLI